MENSIPTGQLNSEEIIKTRLKTQDDKIDSLQAISFGIVVVLFLGFLSLLWTVEGMRREADQFSSQLFIDLIKTTQDTNAKINGLVK